MENFNKIYVENHKVVLNFINMKINDLTIAEELTNDVFMQVHKHLHRFNAELATMKTWIINIAKNKVIDHYRKAKLHTMSINVDSEDTISLIDKLKDTSPTPYDCLANKDTSTKISDAIYGLNKSSFEVAYHFFIEELNYKEISKVLQIPLGTVKGKVHRARKQLQEVIVNENIYA